ncbi:MAG TPA: AsmA-like C-terminal region-containing protein, partial [Myxococcales bacterium]|nr:AsmA-like C-terminal region-containing protein [Myxococcales bacterium]
ELENVGLQVLDDRIDGRGFLQTKGVGDAATKQFDLQLSSARLDLDKILLSSEKKEEEEKPPPDPKTFAGVSGHAAVKIGNVTYKKQLFQNVLADVTMKGDEIDVQTASIQGLGGQIDAGGTRIKLAHPKEPWHIATKIRGIDLEKAAAMSSPKKVLAGKFDGNIVLDGTSHDLSDLTKSLSGVVDGNISGGKFYGKDIIGAAAAPVMSAIPAFRGKVTQGGETDLGQNLPFGITLKEGWARLKAPLKVATPQADLNFGGGVRLDGTLDMPGTVALTPAMVQQLTDGRVKLSTNVPVGLRLVGPATKPGVTDIDAKSAVEAIAKAAGSSLISSVLGGTGDQKQQQAQSQAQQAADKAKEEAANKLKGLFGR